MLLPLTLNLVLFIALIGFAMQQFSGWVDAFMPSLPSWASFLEYLIWPLFVILVLLLVFFSFTMIANIIAAPFNGFLAEKVEVVVRGQDDFPFSWAELTAMVPRTVGRELRKLGYFLPRAIGLLILSFIPGEPGGDAAVVPLRRVDDGRAVHRLPGGQPQARLERDACLAARSAGRAWASAARCTWRC